MGLVPKQEKQKIKMVSTKWKQITKCKTEKINYVSND